MISIIYSDEFLKHDTGRFHPEKPARLSAIVKSLKEVSWSNQLDWQLPTPINIRNDVITLIQKVHTQEHLNRIKLISQRGGGMLDGDTPVSSASYEVALLAVSAWLDGVDFVLSNPDPAFVLARPPGHHATKHTGMGFCLFSNAAIAAYYALEKPEIDRVAILDWDVHHGNGTQDIIEHHPQLAYCSLHEFPCYPGTGLATEKGDYNNILNIPMNAGSTLKEYQLAFEKQVMPFLSNFRPDLLIVSAGYDANQADPLANISLQPNDYGVFTKYILTLNCPILFGLEGGYDLEALSKSVIATLEACMTQ